MARKIRAVLFDAGNTLVFPQVHKIAQDLASLGYAVTVEDFYAADRVGKRKLDEWLWPLLRGGEVPGKPDAYYWTEYLRALVERAGIPEEKQLEAGLRLAEGFKEPSIWSRVFPETPACLEALRRQGFVLGVISNSLGLIEAQLREVKLADYFAFILDSYLVGVEKPHPDIFRMALNRCNCLASEAVFVGDLYSTDIGGALAAGLHGILIDWIGAYPEATVPRIRSLLELDAILASLQNGAG
jgi:HAD superfamily hydrolase (TIGR01549 family)